MAKLCGSQARIIPLCPVGLPGAFVSRDPPHGRPPAPSVPSTTETSGPTCLRVDVVSPRRPTKTGRKGKDVNENFAPGRPSRNRSAFGRSVTTATHAQLLCTKTSGQRSCSTHRPTTSRGSIRTRISSDDPDRKGWCNFGRRRGRQIRKNQRTPGRSPSYLIRLAHGRGFARGFGDYWAESSDDLGEFINEASWPITWLPSENGDG